jgi:hypothetical protein
MKTKTLLLKFSFELEVLVDARFDSDWIAEQFLSSDRFGVLDCSGDPIYHATVLSACSGIKEINQLPSN